MQQTVNGMHHLAIATADIKQQIAFFSDVLGMRLVALYWMHGVEGAWHGFMRLNDACSIAFVQTPGIAAIAPRPGVTHAGTPGSDCAPGTMQHLALHVDSEAELLAMRDRIRSRDVPVMGPIDHGFCQSIYFAGPEGLTLELSTSAEAIDADAWIDPEVVALAGITDEELAAYREPAHYSDHGGRVPQPDLDGPGPHMGFPPERYRQLLGMPDAQLTALMSETEPPVAT